MDSLILSSSFGPKAPIFLSEFEVYSNDEEAMNRRLLILDDEQELRDTYRMILNAPAATPAIVSSRGGGAAAAAAAAPTPATAPLQLDFASSGAEALVKIEHALRDGTPYVGGFFDVKLGPGIDGIETIRRAKTMDPNLLCVFVTAYQDRSIEEITKILGEDFIDQWDFLAKPFSQAEVAQKAQHLIADWDRRRRTREFTGSVQMNEVLAAERMAVLGTMARGIGNEFGSFLLNIVKQAKQGSQANTPQEMAGALRFISDAAERVGLTVRNLMSTIRMDSKREPSDLSLFLERSLQILGTDLRTAKVRVQQEIDPATPQVSVSKVEMLQVFLNLTLNAAQAMDKGGSLYVKIFPYEGGVAVQFTDTGVGIAAENLENVFLPAFTTKPGVGSGLGLTVSKKIVENHGGQITVASDPGQSTTFSIWLPLS